MRTGLSMFAVSLALVAGLPARATDEARVEQLEKEVADLKVLVHDLLAEREAANAESARDAHGVPQHDDPSAPPRLTLRGFADLNYGIESEDPRDGHGSTSNQFTNGDIDLFITSQIAEQLDFLSEVVLASEVEGDSELEIERMLLRWEPRDWFQMALGRGHTPLGYWNRQFHHGTWLQTTVERPLVFRFEDDGGVLPMHYVGLELSGNVETAPGLISYVVGAANGRGPTPEWVQQKDDRNDGKAVAAMVTFHPSAIEGLAIGANVYADEIPPEHGVPARAHHIDERIAGLQLTYTEDPFEVLLENQFIHHWDATTNHAYDSYGGYLQLAYRWGKLKPYYRFDWLELDDRDPFYFGFDEAEDGLQQTVGVRWDWRTWCALKVEYRALFGSSHDSNQGGAQVSFAF